MVLISEMKVMVEGGTWQRLAMIVTAEPVRLMEPFIRFAAILCMDGITPMADVTGYVLVV